MADLDALAAKHGGSSELDSLAAKYGGSADQPSVGQMAGDVGVGVFKGALSTLFHTGDLLRQGETAAVQHLPAPVRTWLESAPQGVKDFVGYGARPLQTPEVQSNITATNTAQKVGKGVEQAAEYLIPGQAETTLPLKIATGALGAAGVALAQTGSPTQALEAGAIGGAASGLASAAGPARRLITSTLGKTTGKGTAVTRAALENPTPELVGAMRGEITGSDVLGQARDAVQNVKDVRAQAYQDQLAKLPSGAGSSIDISPIQREVQKQLQRFGVKAGADGALDFSRSSISDSAAQKVVQDTYGDVMGWGTQAGDRQPLGVDTLVRRIGDRYSQNSQARAFTQALKTTGQQTISAQVPGYMAMKQGYAQASKFLDDLQSLSLDNKNEGAAVKKLTDSFKANNANRQVMVDALSQYSSADLKGMIAGLNLNQWSPSIARSTGAGLLAGIAAHFVSPQTALLTASASPRLMGELLVAMNKTRPLIGVAAQKAAQIAPAVVTETNQ